MGMTIAEKIIAAAAGVDSVKPGDIHTVKLDRLMSNDGTTQTVIEAAADAYGVDAASITLATDIREDLSNESMKMIVMISTIEDELNVTIEIQEASNLNTIGDFVSVVRERL